MVHGQCKNDLSQDTKQELDFHLYLYKRTKEMIKKMERAPDWLIQQNKTEKEKVWLLMDLITRNDLLTDDEWNKYFTQIVNC